jgi:hypothetical protein
LRPDRGRDLQEITIIIQIKEISQILDQENTQMQGQRLQVGQNRHIRIKKPTRKAFILKLEAGNEAVMRAKTMRIEKTRNSRVAEGDGLGEKQIKNELPI